MTTQHLTEDLILDSAFHGECVCGMPLAWWPMNEDLVQYAACPSPTCELDYEIVYHVTSGLLEVA